MKTININGKEFQYKIVESIDYDWHIIATEFYDGVKEIKHKKYWLFGPIITKTVPNYVYRLPYNIEDPSYSKESIDRSMLSFVTYLQSK